MSSSSGPSPGFARAGGFRSEGFDGEISPEDLFNMFFGGGVPMNGGSFGGGFGGPGGEFHPEHVRHQLLTAMVAPVFTASFGPGGFRTARMGGQNRRQEQQAAEPRSMWMQLLPLFVLFAFSLLNALPSLFSTASTPDPRFSFSPSARYNLERTTPGLNVKYHVNSAEFSGHPIAAELARNSNKAGPTLQRFENNIERVYTQDLYSQCQRGLDRRL